MEDQRMKKEDNYNLEKIEEDNSVYDSAESKSPKTVFAKSRNYSK